ncbi:related to U1 small nuclear ribonucleoprotein [Cephalotrichum gorgonifer]|uniref:Related to U1 small nuclear ribonucleoprotein n=1 Tax=Cephalotrichum gorgonifer TaxID=2041049 RepID=A0AAE8MYH1_9PEZI|nr:related to U1 small nuclear ribonucleoprotein [Cephalotrichum gorgonifer]
MTDKLPPNLLALFAPRPPLRYLDPPDFAPQHRKTQPISGLAQFLPALQAYKETDVYVPTESWLEMKDRKKRERKEEIEKLLTEGPKNFKPNEDPNIRGDPFKTLIVARLSYEATEHDLEKEFARFGPIERIRIITDTHSHLHPKKKKKNHRGYAFVVFERERDMRAALDSCDGIRIKDRRIKVDVERGRTVKGWKPLRLGGGLGGRGYTKAMPPRPAGPGGPGGFGGGFRGGFRGGFDGGRGRGGFRGGGFRGGGGGFRGGDRDRGPPNGFGGPPSNAPSGPGYGGRYGSGGDRGFGDRGGSDRGGGDRGFGDRGGGDRGFGDRGFSDRGGGYDSRGSGRSYDDRSGGGGYRDRQERDSRRTGSNMEPVKPRDSNGGYRDRDFDRPRDDDRKRHYDGGGSGYDEPRKIRRY